MLKAEEILSLFPFKEGVYRLARPDRVEAAIAFGWLAVGMHEGKVLMWLDKGRLAG